MHPSIPVHTMLALHVAQQAVMKTFPGKGLFLSIAPSVLPTFSRTRHSALAYSEVNKILFFVPTRMILFGVLLSTPN